MRVTRGMEYAIYAMIYIGLESRNEREAQSRYVTISEISEAYGISRNHLMKVIYTLGQSNLIDTFQGKNGGMKIARSLKEITLGDIVSLFHIESEKVAQISSYSTTAIEVLEQPFATADSQYLHSLHQTTLESLVEQFAAASKKH